MSFPVLFQQLHVKLRIHEETTCPCQQHHLPWCNFDWSKIYIESAAWLKQKIPLQDHVNSKNVLHCKIMSTPEMYDIARSCQLQRCKLNALQEDFQRRSTPKLGCTNPKTNPSIQNKKANHLSKILTDPGNCDSATLPILGPC